MQFKSQRALLWIAIAFSQIYTWSFVYLLDFWPPVSPTLTAAQVLALYSQHNMQFRSGIALMMISGAFCQPFNVVVAAQMARCETGYPLWSRMQLSAGTLGTWLFAFPPFLWGVAAFSVDRNPQITLLVHELAWLCFVTPPTYFALQLIPIAVIALSNKNPSDCAFPRWIGYLTIWTAISASTGVMAMLFKTGPFAWNGILSFYMPLTIFSTWLISMVITMFRAIGRQERAAKGGHILSSSAGQTKLPLQTKPNIGCSYPREFAYSEIRTDLSKQFSGYLKDSRTHDKGGSKS